MTYVRDLENIAVVKGISSYVRRTWPDIPFQIYVKPLRTVDPPVIPPQRLQRFITDVFHNVDQLIFHHKKLLDRLHHIQREEHPIIHSVTATILNAFLNFREAYLEYVPHYPIAAYWIEDEKANNPRFKEFHDVRVSVAARSVAARAHIPCHLCSKQCDILRHIGKI
jgi:RHO1 GDP-GTP exchange protein 1/2